MELRFGTHPFRFRELCKFAFIRCTAFLLAEILTLAWLSFISIPFYDGGVRTYICMLLVEYIYIFSYFYISLVRAQWPYYSASGIWNSFHPCMCAHYQLTFHFHFNQPLELSSFQMVISNLLLTQTRKTKLPACAQPYLMWCDPSNAKPINIISPNFYYCVCIWM